MKPCAHLKWTLSRWTSSTDTSMSSCKHLCEQVHHLVCYVKVLLRPLLQTMSTLKSSPVPNPTLPKTPSLSSFYLVIRAWSSTAAHQSAASGRGGECVSPHLPRPCLLWPPRDSWDRSRGHFGSHFTQRNPIAGSSAAELPTDASAPSSRWMAISVLLGNF